MKQDTSFETKINFVDGRPFRLFTEYQRMPFDPENEKLLDELKKKLQIDPRVKEIVIIDDMIIKGDTLSTLGGLSERHLSRLPDNNIRTY